MIPEVILYLLFCFCFSRQIPSNHTFLVIRRRGASRADHVYRFNKAKALGLLEPVSPVRQLAISVVTNRYPFNNKILVFSFGEVVQMLLIHWMTN